MHYHSLACMRAQALHGKQAQDFQRCQVQGMGFPEIAVDKASPPFVNLVKQNLVKEPVFSFWLDRNVDDATGGELVLGGVDPAHFRGDHVWAPVTRRGYWQFDMGHMAINGRKSICPHGCAAIADTGAPTPLAPRAAVLYCVQFCGVAGAHALKAALLTLGLSVQAPV